MNYVLQFLALCQSHPAATFMVLGGVVSCFYKYLDKYPRLHAFFSVLAHAGVNVPGVVNALGRLLTGVASSAAAGVVGLVLSISVAASSGAIMIFLTLGACTPAEIKAADSVVSTATKVTEDAYMLAAQACVDLVDAGAPGEAKKCAQTLLDVSSYLLAAETDEANGHADVCKLVPVVTGIASAFPAGAPPAVSAALATARSLTVVCPGTVDGGGQ